MIVLITGATSGFGMSCAELFSKKGYKTILIGRRKERLTKLSKKLGLKKNLVIQLDVRDKEEVFNKAKKGQSSSFLSYFKPTLLARYLAVLGITSIKPKAPVLELALV